MLRISIINGATNECLDETTYAVEDWNYVGTFLAWHLQQWKVKLNHDDVHATVYCVA